MVDYSKFSLITVVRGNETQLRNTIRGIEQSQVIPDEIIIVDPNPSFEPIQSEKLNLKWLAYPQPASRLKNPKIAARNFGAVQANFETLCFIDDHCIPSAKFFKQMRMNYHENSGLIMGQPCYVSVPLNENWNQFNLFENAHIYSSREIITELVQSRAYKAFTSLSFMISKSNFIAVGGFNHTFEKCNGSDIDFAFRCKQKGILLYHSPGIVCCQRNNHFNPYSISFREFITNCEAFYRTWKQWPVENWLSIFATQKLIEWNAEADQIEIVMEPTELDALNKLYQPCLQSN